VNRVAELQYLKLPINPDEGFPQAFRLALAARAYTITLYINLLDEEGRSDDATVYDLARDARAFMVMSVHRDGPPNDEEIFHRRLVVDHEYDAAELGFLFKELRVDRRNLGGVGSFGSSVVGGVATRWAS
jgi:hypothetical protein